MFRASDAHYFVKWKGYPVSENTWEPKKSMPMWSVTQFAAALG